MAKTIMISNEVYKQLTIFKQLKNKSYSETLKDMMKNERISTGKDLWKLVGISKNKESWDMHMKELRKEWRDWSEKYA